MSGSRREKGNGGITLRKDGKYAVSYKGHSTTVKTLKQAKAKINEWRTKEARGEPLGVSRKTVATLVEEVIKAKKKNEKLKEKSYERLCQTLKYQIIPTIGDIQISSLTQEDVQEMIDKQASYSTAKKAYDLVNCCMKKAVDNRVISYNPCKGVNLPKATSTSIDKDKFCYTQEQVKAIIAEATSTYKNGTPKYRYGYVILLLLATGMREGESLYLKWEDITTPILHQKACRK